VTALCTANGPSGIRPGVQPIQNFAAGAISDLLYTNGMGWAASLAAGVGILSFDLATFCATDPPAVPNVDASRIADYFNPLNPTGAAELRADMGALIGHYLWFQTCVCTTGPQPTPPAPVAQPTGYQTDNPQLTSQSATPCVLENISASQATFDANGSIAFTFQSSTTLIPAAQWIHARFQAWLGGTSNTPLTYSVVFTLRISNASGVLAQQVVTQAAGQLDQSLQFDLQIPPGSATYAVTAHADGQSGHAIQPFVGVAQYCTQAPASSMQPCCPPDPTLENLIAQVLRLEQMILDSLGGSDAYTRGTAHPGLSGSGTLTVSGLRGIAIDVTAGTPTVPLLEGVPPYQWNLGWVSISDAGGMLAEQRITRQHQIWLPPTADLGTTIGFFLFPGVVATLTELDPA
jgi:hypothetical protein